MKLYIISFIYTFFALLSVSSDVSNHQTRNMIFSKALGYISIVSPKTLIICIEGIVDCWYIVVQNHLSE